MSLLSLLSWLAFQLACHSRNDIRNRPMLPCIFADIFLLTPAIQYHQKTGSLSYLGSLECFVGHPLQSVKCTRKR